MSSFPRTLYRYRSLAGEYGRSGFEDAILRSQMYWQTHTAFNDPFDCSPVLEFGLSRLGWRSYHQGVISRNLSRVDEKRRRAKQRFDRSSIQRLEASLKHAFWSAIGNTAFCCLSTDSQSVLMWSHYADYHRGICLEFRESVKDLTFVALPVNYTKERPIVRPTEEMNTDIFTSCVLSKSLDWEYEREFRMIDHGSGPGYRSFHPERLKSIILGCRVSEADEKYVYSMVSKNRKDIKIRKSVLNSSKYSIDIHEA